ncbi:GNAT family N-acetyltransferase [Gottschalkiaceae bacterium SANA]|nr:GNAT family N-acetyltransferase [Gottschalkiaceae bacterium SANA]
MKFHRLRRVEDRYWEESWEIYQSNFPSGERRLLEDHKRALEDDRYHCMAILEDNQVAGILFYWKLPHFTFAEYLAIGEASKGQGIGSEVVSRLKEQAGRLILEIDPPEDEIAVRRLRFYQREGFVLNPYLHLNLPLRIGQEKLPLRIMTVEEIVSEAEYEAFSTILMTDLIQYGEGYREK